MMGYIEENYGVELGIEHEYLFSFLHEIGHYMTLLDVSISTVLSRAEMDFARLNPKSPTYEEDYRQLTLERMADLWATSFIEENPEVLNINLINV